MSFDKNPTVSIVCTVYNKEKWIGQAIDSFLSQKDVDFEILLIDDASTDASRDIIQKYAEQYPDIIRTLYNDHNLGIAETWHRACLATKGDYIARCDGDDYWIDECKLAKQLAFLEKNPESKWCGTDIDFVDVDGKTVEHNVFTRQIVDLSDSYEKMIEFLVKEDNMTEEEAIEFIDYNTLRTIPYMGSLHPIIVYDLK